MVRVVGLAQRMVGGCDWAAVTRAGAHPNTLAVSDAVARRIDDVQNAVGDGSCLSAAREAVVIYVPDLAVETRWPAFRDRASAETPLQSLLSFEVEHGPPPTALNLYGAEADPFDDEAMATATLFATHTQLAVLHLHGCRRVTTSGRR